MTVSEFNEDFNTISELKYFCDENMLYAMDDVYDSESRDQVISDYISENIGRDITWIEACEYLNDLETQSETGWWERLPYRDWYGIDDDDIEEWKTRVRDEGIGGDIFEPEVYEDSEEEAAVTPEEDTTPIEQEDISMSDLFTVTELLPITDTPEDETPTDTPFEDEQVYMEEPTENELVDDDIVCDFSILNF